MITLTAQKDRIHEQSKALLSEFEKLNELINKETEQLNSHATTDSATQARRTEWAQDAQAVMKSMHGFGDSLVSLNRLIRSIVRLRVDGRLD